MKIDEADAFFSAKGFWRRMVPWMVGSFSAFIGIGVFSLNEGVDNRKLLIIAGIAFLAGPVLQFFRYRWSARRHRELKAQYAERYVQLIEEGKILINPFSVLVLGSPGRQAKVFFPELDGPIG